MSRRVTSTRRATLAGLGAIAAAGSVTAAAESEWTVESVETDGESGYVVGSGGVVRELTPDDRFALDTPTGGNLNAVDVDADAVESSGIVLRG